MTRTGVVGLGNMGRGMAASLARAGFEVVGHDPGLDTPPMLEGKTLPLAADLATLAANSDVIILSLPTAQVVEAVIEAPGGLLSAGRRGMTIIDTTTSHPDTTRRLAPLLAAAGIDLIDAPVSGGPSGAMAGTLGMVLGGEATAIERVRPVLEAMSGVRTHVGPAGDGHALKIINNLLCGANLIVTAEATRLARSLGMDDAKLMAGLNSGSGRNAATEVNFPRWVLNDAFDSGFTMKLMRKDIALAADLAEQAELDLPLLGAVMQQWAASRSTLADDDDFNTIVTMTLAPSSDVETV